MPHINKTTIKSDEDFFNKFQSARTDKSSGAQESAHSGETQSYHDRDGDRENRGHSSRGDYDGGHSRGRGRGRGRGGRGGGDFGWRDRPSSSATSAEPASDRLGSCEASLGKLRESVARGFKTRVSIDDYRALLRRVEALEKAILTGKVPEPKADVKPAFQDLSPVAELKLNPADFVLDFTKSGYEEEDYDEEGGEEEEVAPELGSGLSGQQEVKDHNLPSAKVQDLPPAELKEHKND